MPEINNVMNWITIIIIIMKIAINIQYVYSESSYSVVHWQRIDFKWLDAVVRCCAIRTVYVTTIFIRRQFSVTHKSV